MGERGKRENGERERSACCERNWNTTAKRETHKNSTRKIVINQTRYKTKSQNRKQIQRPENRNTKNVKPLFLIIPFLLPPVQKLSPGLVGSKHLPVLETSEKRERWRNLDVMLVMPAKQRRDPCSGPPKDSTNYRNCVFEFPFILIDKSTMAFLTGKSWRALPNPDTQVGAQNRDLGAIS